MCKESFGKTDILTRKHISLIGNLAVRTIRADQKEGLLEPMGENPTLIEYKVEDVYLYLARKKKFSVPPDLNLPDLNLPDIYADGIRRTERLPAYTS